MPVAAAGKADAAATTGDAGTTNNGANKKSKKGVRARFPDDAGAAGGSGRASRPPSEPSAPLSPSAAGVGETSAVLKRFSHHLSAGLSLSEGEPLARAGRQSSLNAERAAADSLVAPVCDSAAEPCLGPECFGNEERCRPPSSVDLSRLAHPTSKSRRASEDEIIKRQIAALVRRIAARDPEQSEFLQAFEEVAHDLVPVFRRQPRYIKVLETIAEPERVHHFRVPWLDDNGRQQVNRGYRVQFSSALGPYKGGLRFHPTVNLSIVKFLGFEQIFKNALTGLPIGGGKGGSDFDPKGKSDAEILRFCQSFVTSLAEYIGPDQDVPAGDIGVGGREIGYMYGQYKRLTRRFEGAFTGKDPKWGGSLLRPEATGYGVVYFAQEMLRDVEGEGATLRGKRCVISGAGNVAQNCCAKLLELGATVLTMSDSSGFVYAPAGFDEELLAIVSRAKNVDRAGLKVAADRSGGRLQYCSDMPAPGARGKGLGLKGADNGDAAPTRTRGRGRGPGDAHAAATVTGTHLHPHPRRPWGTCALDIAFPCATQNEIDLADAKALHAAGVRMVIEGANMPTTSEAARFFHSKGIAFAPGKAANAGGVAVSALEMTQNSMRLSWTREQVDEKLHEIMRSIFAMCADTAAEYGEKGNYRVGSNIAGFLKVANSVVEQGTV